MTESKLGQNRAIMQTSSPTITQLCEKFQREVGMPARWALDTSCRRRHEVLTEVT